MAASPQRLYFVGQPVIRPEHFGVLILLKNGSRLLVDSKYLQVLKSLAADPEAARAAAAAGLTNEEIDEVLQPLLARKVLAADSACAGAPRFVENAFVSFDCLSFPRIVYWECTQSCNLKCAHCYSDSGQREPVSMSVPQVQQLIDELDANGAEFLSIGGGEPLLYPPLCEVVRHAHDRGLAVELTTNGTLVTEARAARLRDAGLEYIQVSLDGASAESYGALRIGACFDQVLASISLLAQHFTVSVCAVATRYNAEEMEQLVDLCKSMGVKYFRVLPLMQVGRARGQAELAVDAQTLKRLNLQLQQRKKHDREIAIQFNENLVQPDRKNIPWMPEEHYGCSAGRSTCAVDWAGRVYPCSYLRGADFFCGDVREHTLAAIWRDSPALRRLRGLSALQGKCAACSFLKNCRGGCRAAAYLHSGRLDASDPLCTVCPGD